MELNCQNNDNLIVEMVSRNDISQILESIRENHCTRFAPFDISNFIMREVAKQGKVDLFKQLHTQYFLSIPLGTMRNAALSNNPFMFDYVYNFSPTYDRNSRFVDEIRDAFVASIEYRNVEMVKHICTSCDLQAKTPFVRQLFFDIASTSDKKQNNDEMVFLLKQLSDVNLF